MDELVPPVSSHKTTVCQERNRRKWLQSDSTGPCALTNWLVGTLCPFQQTLKGGHLYSLTSLGNDVARLLKLSNAMGHESEAPYPTPNDRSGQSNHTLLGVTH